jgi:nucleoside-diphosphate-sugar epimerase
MNKTVAIIGSNSFAAKYIIDLLSDSYEVFGFCRNNKNSQINYVLFDYPAIQFDFDLLLKYDHIIYTAGAGIQSNKADTVNEIFEMNAFLPIKIFNFLNSAGFKGAFVTFGSYSEIGQETKVEAYDEWQITATLKKIHNDYGNSKRIFTRFISNLVSEMKYFHLILPTIYGYGENPLRLIPYVIKGLVNNETIKLTNGQQMRQYLHCNDLARLVKILIEKEGITSGIYNITPFEELSVKEVVNKISITLGIHGVLEFGAVKRTDELLPNLILNTDKLKKLNIWEPTISIEESVGHYLVKKYD